MKKHDWWMLLGCVAPLLLIFFLPLFGIAGDSSTLLFICIAVCFGMHFFMMQGHHGDHHDDGGKKEGQHGHH